MFSVALIHVEKYLPHVFSILHIYIENMFFDPRHRAIEGLTTSYGNFFLPAICFVISMTTFMTKIDKLSSMKVGGAFYCGVIGLVLGVADFIVTLLYSRQLKD